MSGPTFLHKSESPSRATPSRYGARVLEPEQIEGRQSCAINGKQEKPNIFEGGDGGRFYDLPPTSNRAARRPALTIIPSGKSHTQKSHTGKKSTGRTRAKTR